MLAGDVCNSELAVILLIISFAALDSELCSLCLWPRLSVGLCQPEKTWFWLLPGIWKQHCPLENLQGTLNDL